MADRTLNAKVPLVVSFLASVGTFLVAVTIGAQTTFTAFTFAGKLTGALMVAGALALVVGMVTTVRLLAGKATPVDITTTIVVTAVALGINFVMAVTQLTVGDRNYHLAYWITLVTLLAWALHDLVRALGPFGTYPRKLALGFGIPSILAIASFTYAQIYLPYAQQPSVAMQPSFGTVGPDFNKSGFIVPFSVTLSTKAVPIYILGATYTVMGRKATVSSQVRPGDELRKDLQNNDDPAARLAVDGEEFVQGGVLFEPGSGEYVPDEVHTATKVVRLAANTGFDSLRLATQVVYLRADRASIDKDQVDRSRTVGPTDGQDGQFVANWGKLSERGAISRSTRNPIWFYHEWAVVQQSDGHEPQTTTFLTWNDPATNGVTDVQDDKVDRRYGLWNQTEVITLPLPG